MQTVWAEQALVGDSWMKDVSVVIGADGRIASVASGAAPSGIRVGALLPAPVNLHSHAFQRAMAGLTERRSHEARDTFWTWRRLMYRFLDALTPDDIEAIAAFVQMEMLESGYAAVAEFHYVHHQADGTPYDDLAELATRIAAASQQSGIGLTLLPVLYQQAGCDGAALAPGQVRFGNGIDRFAELHERATRLVASLAPDARIGVAPHSLRAVNREGLAASVALAPNAPLHMHLAEQAGEVEEVVAAYGKRPVEWLLETHAVDARWCLIHCTQMNDTETIALARTGAVAGLCPITESSLGDGIFNGATYVGAGGRFGIGSDSNIRISLTEELRTLEYSQRLRDRGRAILATEAASTGRALYDGAVRGGAQAAGRAAGAIEAGKWADLVAIDTSAIDLGGRQGDELLDSYIFAGDDRMIRDVWSAGRRLVQAGRHVNRDAIAGRYRRAMDALKGRL
ncbi:MAG TPA: formimidoylglutamate deiminase [Kaistia sp.]|nr:formimidoylglutamate deiminase [Kaistia sp.]